MFKAFNNFDINIFGASHAEEIGVTIKGLPVGDSIDFDVLQSFVDRRKSGNNAWSTPRKEEDKVEIESGIVDGRLQGDFRAVIKNTSAHSSDYEALKTMPRPSHADYAATVKYNGDVDLRGGGRYSGRMTAPMCIAGGIAKQLLENSNIRIGAYVCKIGKMNATSYGDKGKDIEYGNILLAQKKGLFTLDEESDREATIEILSARSSGDSIGGAVECLIYGIPTGLGDALYDGLEGRLSASIFAIPAVKAIEFGAGVAFAELHGSDANDPLCVQNGQIKTVSNNNGGINGGISNGMPIALRVTFKPTPSIAIKQQSVDLKSLKEVSLTVGGRHDACIVPRAVVAVEAAVALTILDCTLDEKNLRGVQ